MRRPRAEWLGRHGSVIFTPEYIAQGADRCEMEVALAEGRAEDRRWHARKDGSLFWADGLLMLLRDVRGGTYEGRQARRGPREVNLIKAVIFDVDGTLVDSNDLHVEAWREAFKCYGKELKFEDVHGQMGKGGDQLMPVFCTEEELERFGEELESRRVELFKSDYLPRVRPFPRVRELFERIKADGLQIALASSAKEEELEQHKKSMGVEDLLEAATSADDAEHSKPHPDIFQAALAGLKGVEPAEAVVVGDTPYDVQAAAKAGMRTVGLLSGGFTETALREAGAVAVYRDVSDLLDNYDTSPLARAGAGAAGGRG